MAIIAITQHIGTRGLELARLTTKRLGYRLLTSEQLVAATSSTYRVPPEALAIVDERRPTFWTRFKTDTGRFTAFFSHRLKFRRLFRCRMIYQGTLGKSY